MLTYNDLPDHLSHSARTDADRCKKLFQLSRIIKAQPVPAWFFAGGTAVHRATEDFDLGREVKPWEEYFYPEVSRLMQIEPDVTRWLVGGAEDAPDRGPEWNKIGPTCVKNWMTFASSEGVEIDDVEIDVTCLLPGCYIPVKGFVDRVIRHPVHGEMIIDIKTSKNRPKGNEQLETYAALLHQKTGRRITKGAFFLAREGRLTRVADLSDATPQEVGGRFGQSVQDLAYRTWEPAKQFKCKWCPHSLNCFAVSGDTVRTRFYDPDNPHYSHPQSEEPPL